MGKRRRVSWFGAGVLGTLVFGPTAAIAGVGLAVVPELPGAVRVGQAGLTGGLTIRYANSAPDDTASNIVADITLTPSCGSDSVSGTCSGGAEDPGVVAIDPSAIGRAGTACAGVVFKVTVVDEATGEVTFDAPQGFIVLGPEQGPGGECTIDFTFGVTALPQKAGALDDRGSSVRTSVRAGASVFDETDQVVSSTGASRTWVVGY